MNVRLRSWTDRCWHALFGSLCLLCRQSVQGSDARRQLCSHCLADLPWQPEPEAVPEGSDCIRQVIPLRYEGAARNWVLAAKHDQGLVAARVLGTLLADAVVDAYLPADPLPELILPVPLSLLRLTRRGFNQAARIALPVAGTLGMRLDHGAVRRLRHTALQPGLSATEREANLAGAFRARRDLAGRSVAIVDDVLTTGATVRALTASLLSAGVRDVHVWCPTGASSAATLPASKP